MRKEILLNVGGIDVFEGMELEGISDVDGWYGLPPNRWEIFAEL